MLIASFLALDLVSAHSQLQGRLSTLADIVGQNSTAALNFDDRDAAMEVLAAFRAEAPVVSACLYGQDAKLFCRI